MLRSRKAASEKAEAHVQAYVRDSADIAIYFAAQITNRTKRKRISNGYVPGIPSSGTRAVGLHRAQPLTIAIGPRPPHHLKCLCVDSQDAPLPLTASNKSLQVGRVVTSSLSRTSLQVYMHTRTHLALDNINALKDHKPLDVHISTWPTSRRTNSLTLDCDYIFA